MAQLSINQIVSIIEDIATRHKQINDFGYGQTHQIGDTRPMNYPYLWVTTQPSTVVSNGSKLTTIEFEMTFIIADYLSNVDSSEVGQKSTNGLEITSDLQLILFDIISEINNHPFYVTNRISIKSNVTISPTYDERDDNVNAWAADVTITMPFAHKYCIAPISELPNSPVGTPQAITVFVKDDEGNTIATKAISSIDNIVTLPDINVTGSDGITYTSNAGADVVCDLAYNNLVEINLNFGIGSTIEWTLLAEIEQAAYYTSIDLTNFDSYIITVDAVTVSFPFTLLVGETLVFTGVLTNAEVEGLATFNGVYTNDLFQNDYVITLEFAPDHISGIQLWLDATDLSTITKDGSNFVSSWVDKSTNSYVINQAVAVSQAKWQNNKELLFDGVNDFYDLTQVLTPLATTTTGTWCCWVKPVNITLNETILSFAYTTNSTYIAIFSIAGKIRGNVINPAGVVLSQSITNSTVLSNSTWNHVSMVQDGISLKLYVNGIITSFTTSGSNLGAWFNNVVINNGRLGCIKYSSGSESVFFKGSIAEPLMYSRNLTSDEILQIYNYNKNTYV